MGLWSLFGNMENHLQKSFNLEGDRHGFIEQAL